LSPRGKKPLFLNLGSGPRGLDDAHWVNIDGFRESHVHYLTDFLRPLPFKDNSFVGVFCEHVLEHFCLEDGLALAAEVRRVLHPGGCFRVVVPDAELILRRYFDEPNELISQRGSGCETAMEVVNTYFRQRYEHQFLYDWTIMQRTLMRAGFVTVVRASSGAGALCNEIVLDDPKYEWESLYVEAIEFNLSTLQLFYYTVERRLSHIFLRRFPPKGATPNQLNLGCGPHI
jgi:predicted SAM-dependent methyltransferase